MLLETIVVVVEKSIDDIVLFGKATHTDFLIGEKGREHCSDLELIR